MLLSLFLNLGGKGLGLNKRFCGNGHEGYDRDGELLPLCLFLVILEHIDVL